MKDMAHGKELMRWIVGHIDEQDIAAEWVSDFVPIKKATLNFPTKFWWATV